MDNQPGQQELQPADGHDAVIDTTTATFRQDVLVDSVRQPVLVDFWAPWCQPCKQLDPILRKVTKAAAGKIKLVKMNIDDHPQIAGQLGIKSIPAVIAFQKGQPVDGFVGNLPESQVKGFVERLVGPIAGEAADLVAEAEEVLSAGDLDTAIAMFQQALQVEAGNPKAVAGLARAYLEAGQPDQAEAVLGQPPANGKEDAAISAARAALSIAQQSAVVGAFGDLEKQVEADPANHQARFDLALAYNSAGEREKAADALLEIVRRDRKWNDDQARKQLVQFFEAWGPVDDVTVAARRKLSGMLFS